MQLIFDKVCVDSPEGRQWFQPDQFIQAPLHLRIQYIMEKKVSFWKSGIEVDLRQALNNYRMWSAVKGATSTRL